MSGVRMKTDSIPKSDNGIHSPSHSFPNASLLLIPLSMATNHPSRHRFNSLTVFFFLLLFSLTPTSQCHRTTFTFEIHHGLSESVKTWFNFNHHDFPVKGSLDYYAALANRDRILLRRLRQRRNNHRHLSSSSTIDDDDDDEDALITFSDGNSTLRISSLGFLHYATVSLGTPSKKFLVALDTGSDLFWVPCDCTKCAPSTVSHYGSDYELSIYNPKESSTSRKITCNNNLCAHRNRCLGTFSDCPYAVSYVSTNTSTSGVLVEDILHLTVEDGHPGVLDAWITFGCGQVQTGSFLDFAAPNGLFGLGMEKISVPSILSQVGLIADSFSMCFGRDGFGRISFGDKGTPDQEETPFISNLWHPTYNVSITQIRVGMSLTNTNFSALFDSGTSFTYLVDPVYTALSESFDLQVRDSRRPPDSKIPFKYCYDMSSDASSSLIPSMSLTMIGGSHFLVYDPIIVITNSAELVYCLAVVKSADLNIIGQNFMTGYRVVFDRENLLLGWKKFDCYDTEDSNALPINRQNSTNVSPAVSVRPGGLTPDANNDTGNSSQISVKPHSGVSGSPQQKYKSGLAVLVLFLYTLAFF